MSGLAGQDQIEKSQMERLLAEVLSTASCSHSGTELTLERWNESVPEIYFGEIRWNQPHAMSARDTKRAITNVPRPRLSHGNQVEDGFVLAPGAAAGSFFAYDDVQVNKAAHSCMDYLSQFREWQG